jgi:hypothetical protein
MVKYLGWLAVSALGSLLGLSACQSLPTSEPYQGEKVLVGMAEEKLLACAGPPLRRVTQGEATFFLYVNHAGPLDRTFPGSKGSISDIRHGCEASITVQEGKVATVQYRPFPEGSGAYHHCEDIVRHCVP